MTEAPSDAIGLSDRLLAEIGQPVIYRNDAVLREAATALDALQARVKELEGKLSTSEAGHQRLFDKYQSALKDGASNPPTREAIAAALRETAYKYFGDYELSPSQWDAVHCLENAAKCFMDAESRATSAEQQRDCLEAQLDALSSSHRDLASRLAAMGRERDEAYERAAQAAELFGDPYTLNNNTGAMMFRAVTEKIAAAIRRLAAGTEKEGK